MIAGPTATDPQPLSHEDPWAPPQQEPLASARRNRRIVVGAVMCATVGSLTLVVALLILVVVSQDNRVLVAECAGGYSVFAPGAPLEEGWRVAHDTRWREGTEINVKRRTIAVYDTREEAELACRSQIF